MDSSASFHILRRIENNGPLPQAPRDPLQLAKLIGDILTGQIEDRAPTPEEQGKDPAAVALGRKGGLKGGKARPSAMTKRARSAAAKKAAKARWQSYVAS